MKWGKVEKGADVVLAGKTWHVDKIKVKGEKVKVTVSLGHETFTRELSAKAKVELDKRTGAGVVKSAAAEWKAHDKALGPEEVKRRNAVLKVADTIEEPTEGESNVMALLDGVPVAVENVNGSWTMPPVGPDTIEAHLYLFHGFDPGDVSWPATYLEQVEMHDASHDRGDFPAFHVHKLRELGNPN